MKTILLSLGFVLLCFYFYDTDGFSATLFGKENKSYFVDENSGWPYKSYKKEPGYEYFIKDNKVCKKRSSNIEQNQNIEQKQVEEEIVQKKGDLNTCTKCEGDGIIDYCTICRSSGNIHCSSCRGYGNIDGRTCQNCSGSGLLICYNCKGNPEQATCHVCEGSGVTKFEFLECWICHGAKIVDGKDCEFCGGKGGTYIEGPSK